MSKGDPLRRDKYPQPHPGIQQRRPVMMAHMFQQPQRTGNQRYRAQRAGDGAQRNNGPRRAHPGQQRQAGDGQPGGDNAQSAGGPRLHPRQQQRADQITSVIGRRGEIALVQGQQTFIKHQRQHAGEGKAPVAHADHQYYRPSQCQPYGLARSVIHPPPHNDSHIKNNSIL